MNQVKHTDDFRIDQPIDVLFPLFSAEGEKCWVPDWDYKNIMGSTDLHEDYIFVTENHDHAASAAIWIVKKYDSNNHHVEFYKIEAEEIIGIIRIICDALSGSKTKVSVTYEYIALTKKGNEFISRFTNDEYKVFIGEWKQLLEKYFNT